MIGWVVDERDFAWLQVTQAACMHRIGKLWEQHSVEYSEYTVMFRDWKGRRTEADIPSSFATRLQELFIQRSRWMGGQ